MKEFDALDILLDAVIKDATVLAIEELADELPEPEPVEFSKSHQRRMKAIFRGPQRRLRMKRIVKYSQRIAVVLLVMILVSAATVFSVEAWRIQFLNFVVSVSQTNTDISFTEDDKGDSYSDDLITLGYIPDGFVLVESDSRIDYIVLGFMKNESFFRISMTNIDALISIDTENAKTQKTQVGKYEAFISTNDNATILVWHDTVYAYRLSGNIDEGEIIHIAENISKTE